MPQECLSHDILNTLGASALDELIATAGCCIFRKFLKSHFLRLSTAFTNDSVPFEMGARINTLGHCKDYCMVDGLGAVRFTVVNKQVKLALVPLVGEEKFLRYPGLDK